MLSLFSFLCEYVISMDFFLLQIDNLDPRGVQLAALFMSDGTSGPTGIPAPTRCILTMRARTLHTVMNTSDHVCIYIVA